MGLSAKRFKRRLCGLRAGDAFAISLPDFSESRASVRFYRATLFSRSLAKATFTRILGRHLRGRNAPGTYRLS